MTIDLVQVRTADGVRLDGSLARPSSGAARPLSVDSVLAIHGTGSNFYSGHLFDNLSPKLVAAGLPVLRVNTRGHDVISNAATMEGPRRLGSSLERVEECRHDVLAWLEFLAQRGFEKIAVIGHSLGAIKAIYTLVHDRHPAVSRLVLISPPRLSFSHFLTTDKREQFLGYYRQAEQLVAAGQGETLFEIKIPLSFLVSAESFLDKYGQDEKYNFLRQLDRLTVPCLCTFGSLEVAQEVAFTGLPEEVGEIAAKQSNLRVITLEGANHIYTGQIEPLAANILAWLGNV